jgi:hypothetical protein
VKYSKWLLAFFVGTTLTGCALVTEMSVGVFATTTKSLAVVNGQILSGEVQLVPDRTGSVTLSANSSNLGPSTTTGTTPISSCMGRLRFTGTVAGEMDLRCNDTSTITLHFSLIADATGYAYSQAGDVPASLTFGLKASQAKAYLRAPFGKVLVESPGGVGLELR